MAWPIESVTMFTSCFNLHNVVKSSYRLYYVRHRCLWYVTFVLGVVQQIVDPHVLPYLNANPGTIFMQDIATQED